MGLSALVFGSLGFIWYRFNRAIKSRRPISFVSEPLPLGNDRGRSSLARPAKEVAGI